MKTTATTKTFGEMKIGSIVNYSNMIFAEDVNYVILRHFTDVWGNWTEVLNLETQELDSYTQHTRIDDRRWKIVKEQ